MSSDNFEETLQGIIDEALSDIPEKSYGQLGFMETDIVSSIYSSLEGRIPNAEIISAIKEARVSSLASKVSLKITDLHTITHNCKKCQLSSISPALPKWNVNNPDVLFVLESSYLDSSLSDFLISTLKEAGFSSENICLTYLLRCPVTYPDQKYIDNCVSYLQSEIQIMNPKIICTMGANVLSALFGTDLKIKDYKQKISWLGSWAIFPVYSLSYVLKSGETAKESFKQDINQIYQICYKKADHNEHEVFS